jgi:hypothetical protein
MGMKNDYAIVAKPAMGSRTVEKLDEDAHSPEMSLRLEHAKGP